MFSPGDSVLVMDLKEDDCAQMPDGRKFIVIDPRDRWESFKLPVMLVLWKGDVVGELSCAEDNLRYGTGTFKVKYLGRAKIRCVGDWPI